MRRSVAQLVVLCITVGFGAPSSFAATAAEVESALEKAKKYIYAQQKPDGTWEPAAKRSDMPEKPDWRWSSDEAGGQWGGQTALAVFALLVAGENPQDEMLARAVDFLLKADIIGVYALGIRAQALMMLPESVAAKATMRRDLQKLLGAMETKGKTRGFYDYVPQGTSYSLSRAQYGVLGVWAAAQSGQEVPSAYWSEVEKAWIGSQEADGGWRYQPGKPDPPVTAGITAVGVATLFIVQDQLYGTRGLDCSKPFEIPAIQKGVDWMTKNFDKVASEEKYDRDFPLPTLYAVERVGVTGGLKYFGPHDWYAKGSDYLVKKQAKNGSWTGGIGALPNTCFGVVFLSRGRAPVVINKLDYVADAKAATGAWNRRPRDVSNLTRWMSRASERELNWQVMNLQAPMADWHDAPIMYLAGSDPLKIGKEHVAKLREYVEGGGMVLINADCARSGFLGSAQKLASEMFPNYEFRELPADHPINSSLYSREKWKTKPSLRAISNGVRELVVLIPQADPAKAWQRGVFRGFEEQFQLAANIVYYASDPAELRFKGDSHYVSAEDEKAAKTTASLKLARLQYKGNWDPEPGGWRRMRGMLRDSDKLDLTVRSVDLGKGPLDDVKVAHLTGTTKVKLDDAAKAQLKKFVAGGGLLIVDAAGGSEAFASSIEGELESLGTGAKLETLSPEHSLFGGKDGVKVAYRTFAKKALMGKAAGPRIKAVRVGDRLGIVFSREDLSAGIVGNSVGGVIGYTPATATELVRRLILRAADIEPAVKKAAPESKEKSKTEKKFTSAKKKKTSTEKPAAPPSGTGLD